MIAGTFVPVFRREKGEDGSLVGFRVELRTGTGLERRWLSLKKPGAFQEVFRWDDLSRIVPGKRGFKYYRVLSEPNPLRRFWKAHLSDEYSGEVHVEAADRERILRVLEARGAPSSAALESPGHRRGSGRPEGAEPA